MYPDFRADDVIASRVARARDVQAISTLNYSSDFLPALATSIDHVFVVNSAQIAYGTLNVNETLALAARQANALAPLLRNGAGPSVAASAAVRSQDTGGRVSAGPSPIRTVAARA